MRRSLALSLAIVAIPLSANAQLRQPSRPDRIIPTGPGVQTVLDAAEGRAGAIDAQLDAAITPETFVPECVIHFLVLEREAGDHNAFGWYNADSDSPPPEDQRYEIVTWDQGVGTTVDVDIRSDSRYRGGSIGFFMHNVSQDTFFYTENGFNPGSMPGMEFIHRLIYRSTAAAAFYFAWEDRISIPSGDDDFNDLLMRVSNIACTGAGERCDTSLPGVCALGLTQCIRGDLTCVPVRTSAPEICDALDNDCNGETDEGDLCDPGFLCRFGRCIRRCGTFEFACASNYQCVDDVCVEDDCVDAACDVGQVCRGGECEAPCDGVVCPAGQDCYFGRCVDPCEGVTCDDGQVCEQGVCREHCRCRDCGDGLSCDDGDTATGMCLDPTCIGVVCEAGQHCEMGACIDDCAGAICPHGQGCEMGACLDLPDAGVAHGDAGMGIEPPPTGMDAAFAADGGRDPALGTGATPLGDGCGCRLAGAAAAGGAAVVRRAVPPWAASLLTLGLIVVLGRGRRRRPAAHRR